MWVSEEKIRRMLSSALEAHITGPLKEGGWLLGPFPDPDYAHVRKKDIANVLSEEDFVTCETCGCAVLKDAAIKGKGIVKTKPYNIYSSLYESNTPKDYIYYPYYCKAHGPKVRKSRAKKRKSTKKK